MPLAVDHRLAAEMRGEVPLELCGQSDHAITADERTLALDIAGAMALEHGIDLDAHIRAHRARYPEN